MNKKKCLEADYIVHLRLETRILFRSNKYDLQVVSVVLSFRTVFFPRTRLRAAKSLSNRHSRTIEKEQKRSTYYA